MRYPELYSWQAEISQRLPCLKKWQVLGVALWTIGIIMAERCTISKVAEALQWAGKADSMERRLQRFLDNRRLPLGRMRQQWVAWVASWVGNDPIILLVDETKLGHHLAAMVVGIAYRGCCIPVAWRCYDEKAYPAEGQVGLIRALLQDVYEVLATYPQEKIVEMDRGLGTSPDLVRAFEAFPGFDFLWRVQGHVHFRPKGHHGSQALKSLAQPGRLWVGEGHVFKKKGWLTAYAYVYQAVGYTDVWCLISNRGDLCATDYGLRYWQEASFRDLKSDGWQWQRSRVWHPLHADHLIFVMTLAYAWVLSYGTWCATDETCRRLVERASPSRFSIFRLGLRYLNLCIQTDRPLFFSLYLIPQPLFTKSVVT